MTYILGSYLVMVDTCAKSYENQAMDVEMKSFHKPIYTSPHHTTLLAGCKKMLAYHAYGEIFATALNLARVFL